LPSAAALTKRSTIFYSWPRPVTASGLNYWPTCSPEQRKIDDLQKLAGD
jgi:hypothetical protein